MADAPDRERATHRCCREPQDVVVTPEGLVGQVTKVFGSVSKVLLITDPDSAVRAIDGGNRAAIGVLQHGSASNSLALRPSWASASPPAIT